MSVDLVAEVERMTDADKVRKMRCIRELAPFMIEAERLKLAQAFTALAAQFTDAAAHLRIYRHDPDYIPEFLRTRTT